MAMVHRITRLASCAVSMAMLVADSAARHLPFECKTRCPAGPVAAARAIVHANEPVASAAPELSVTCTLTV